MSDGLPPQRTDGILIPTSGSTERRAALRQLVFNWGVILTGMLLYNGLSGVALILLARRVEPIVYGQYLSSFSLASFLVVLPGFGLDAWLLTEPQADRHSAEGLLRSAIRARLILLLPWFGLMLVLGLLLPPSTFPPKLLLPICLGVAADSITLLVYASLRTQDRHQPVTLLQAGSALALFIFVLLLPNDPEAATYFAAGRALLSIVMVAIVLMAYSGQGPIARPVHSLLTAARPFMTAEAASAIYVKADMTLLSLLLGAAATAIYGPAVNLLQMSFLTLRALFYFAVPRLARAFRHSVRAFRQERLIQLGAQLILGLGTSAVFFLFADELITILFQDKYQSSVAVLRLLSPIPLLRSLNFALGGILAVSGRQAIRSKIQVAAAIANVIGNLLVIIPFGVVGTALVYIASELLLTVGYAIVTLKREPVASI
jgi:O-antigen/teichoic acid export membrane protein